MSHLSASPDLADADGAPSMIGFEKRSVEGGAPVRFFHAAAVRYFEPDGIQRTCVQPASFCTR